jgi:hypothetical protein
MTNKEMTMKKTRKRSKRRARLTTLDILATVLGVIAFSGEALAYTEHISYKDGFLINGFAVLGLEIVYNRGRLPRNFSFASYSRRGEQFYSNRDSSSESFTEYPTDSIRELPPRTKANLSKMPFGSLPPAEVPDLDSSSEDQG